MNINMEFQSSITKIDFYDSFCKLYSKKNIAKISIQELCSLAGYNRSTFHKYFQDIYDLKEKLENELIQCLAEQSDSRMIDERSHETLSIVAGIYETNAKYFSVLLNKDMEFVQKMKDILRPYMLKNYVSVDPRFNSYAIEAGMTVIITTFTHWYNMGQQIPAIDISTYLMDILSNGVWKSRN